MVPILAAKVGGGRAHYVLPSSKPAPLPPPHLASRRRLQHALDGGHRLCGRDALGAGEQAGHGQAEALPRALPAGTQPSAQPLEGVDLGAGSTADSEGKCEKHRIEGPLESREDEGRSGKA